MCGSLDGFLGRDGCWESNEPPELHDLSGSVSPPVKLSART